MPLIKIDGKEYEVTAGQNLLQSCLELGLDLPYFCWHPAMGSVGACRQCAVVQYQNEEDSRGRIVMGCMTPVTDGAIFSLDGDKARGFREAIVESLMLNHPHDCPVCAEGGECHLQDMTVMVGHRDRHYRGRKNTHRNQYLGPLIHHEMNRCITCYRCTRYYRDYAGGDDLAAMAAHDHIYFGRHQEGVLESPFAGNLVEVCPTGVFTDKTLVHEYTRKWDLQSAPSVCVGCALGCNTLPGERYGKLKRIHNRYNREVNGYFLCDRGRFGGGFVNSEQRMNRPGRRQDDGSFQVLSGDDAIAAIAAQWESGRVAGIGSPRASVESNVLLRELVGADKFSIGAEFEEQRLLDRILGHIGSSPAHNPSLREIESADAVLVLGEDVTHTAPRMALSLRQSVRNKAFQLATDLGLEVWQDAAIRNLAQDQRSPLHIIAAADTALDDVAASTSRLAIKGQLALAQAVNAALAGDAATDSLAATIAADLSQAQRPLIVAGTAAHSAALIDAAAAIAGTLSSRGSQPMLGFCLPECNSMGSATLVRDGCSTPFELLEQAKAGEIELLLIVENDLHRTLGRAVCRMLREHIPYWIGMDCLETSTLELCDLVLPAASFDESEGTLINSEGRAQRFFPVHPPAVERQPSYSWLSQMAELLGRDELAFEHFDALSQHCATRVSLLSGIAGAAPDHAFRSHGLKVPRQPHRYSGRTAMRADVSVHEPKQPDDTETALAYSMEGCADPERPGAMLSYVWAPGWNSNQSLHKFQAEIGGSLRGGTAGVRLLDGFSCDAPSPLAETNARLVSTAASSDPQFELQPRHRIYGSEETSVHAPGIAQLAGSAALELNSADAGRLDAKQGDAFMLGTSIVPLSINDAVAPGVALYSAGYPETWDMRPGGSSNLRKVEALAGQSQIIGSDGGGGND